MEELRFRPNERRAPDAGVAERWPASSLTIRRSGDEAVRRYSEQFDSWSPAQFRLR